MVASPENSIKVLDTYHFAFLIIFLSTQRWYLSLQYFKLFFFVKKLRNLINVQRTEIDLCCKIKRLFFHFSWEKPSILRLKQQSECNVMIHMTKASTNPKRNSLTKYHMGVKLLLLGLEGFILPKQIWFWTLDCF